MHNGISMKITKEKRMNYSMAAIFSENISFAGIFIQVGQGLGLGFEDCYPKRLVAILELYTGHNASFFPYCTIHCSHASHRRLTRLEGLFLELSLLFSGSLVPHLETWARSRVPLS